eukprot:6283645-Pyramimonas_sp.AAC.1
MVRRVSKCKAARDTMLSMLGYRDNEQYARKGPHALVRALAKRLCGGELPMESLIGDECPLCA